MKRPLPRNLGRRLASAAAIVLLGVCSASADERADVDAGTRIGKVIVDRVSGTAKVPARICLREGILDYLAVAPGSGKEYESLLVLDCEPSHLHAALLALGARPGRIEDEFKGIVRGDPIRGAGAGSPPGDRVRISVIWDAEGKTRSAPVEAWLIDRRTKRPPERLDWTFTGSFFAPTFDGKGTAYVADQERLVVALLYHGACVLNLARAAGNPYRASDQGFEVNPAALPSKECLLQVRFRPVISDERDKTRR